MNTLYLQRARLRVVAKRRAIAGVVLPPGAASVGNDFAEVPAGRQISGRVFADGNNDGVFNSGADTGLAGVQVVLTGTDPAEVGDLPACEGWRWRVLGGGDP